MSANLIRTQSSFDKPLRASATPGIASATNNPKKPSPSPSIKRGKAERLLKEHGSPPGMRVTAGGRVVPSDLPPLSSVRFGSNNMKPPTLRSGDHSNALAAQTQQELHNNLQPQVQIVGTQAVIRIGDKVYALPAYDQNYPMASIPPSLDGTKQSTAPPSTRVSSLPLVAQASRTTSPFFNVDIPTLEAQWASKKEELRYVEQTEVLQADQQGPIWRNQMISKKKSLILEIDALRKQISQAKEVEASKGGVSGAQTTLPVPGAPAPVAPAGFVPSFQQPIAPALYSPMGVPLSVPAPSPFAPMLMYPPYSGTVPPGFSADVPAFVPSEPATNGTQAPKAFGQSIAPSQSPGSASRRSHAVPIKKPDESAKPKGSTLDPKSPTYEPVSKMTNTSQSNQAQAQVPPTPSPVKSSPWCSNEAGSAQFGTSDKHEGRAISQKPSLSSIDTTDFFPTNTHEHSSTRMAPSKASKPPSRDNTIIPATPDKTWPTGPWNPPSSTRSGQAGLSAQNDPTRRLSTFPEAFGRQGSLPSSVSKPTGGSAMSSAALRTKSSAETSTPELNWPAIASKPVSHAPSTYQEGYQAGMQHSGLPDNVEVLSGYADGILQFLKEKTIKAKDRSYNGGLFAGHADQETSSARSSMRNYMASATFHDSAVSFAENMRSAKGNSNASVGYRQSIYSPRGDDLESAMGYSLPGDASRDQYQPAQPMVKSMMGGMQRKEEPVRSDFGQSNMAFTRQYSGNTMSNRVWGAPVSSQRYFPAQKDFTQDFNNGNNSYNQPLRPMTHQRLSGLDGAMDDLAGLAMDAHEQNTSTEAADTEASCFKSASGKKQSAQSPAKSTLSNGKDESSPGKAPGSPRKPGEHSPAKAKLEHVTNKLRRPRKDDPRTMSPEDKHERTEKWRRRFRQIKVKEAGEIAAYKNANPLNDDARR